VSRPRIISARRVATLLVVLAAATFILLDISRRYCFALRFGGVWSQSCAECRCASVRASNRNLANATLRGGNLDWCKLHQVDLSHANLSGAHLIEGVIDSSNFSHANMRKAMLYEAQITKCSFGNANLESADFRGAQIEDSDLSHCELSGARLDRCQYDSKTRWPAGFDPREHGAGLAAGPRSPRLQ